MASCVCVLKSIKTAFGRQARYAAVSVTAKGDCVSNTTTARAGGAYKIENDKISRICFSACAVALVFVMLFKACMVLMFGLRRQNTRSLLGLTCAAQCCSNLFVDGEKGILKIIYPYMYIYCIPLNICANMPMLFNFLGSILISARNASAGKSAVGTCCGMMFSNAAVAAMNHLIPFLNQLCLGERNNDTIALEME